MKIIKIKHNKKDLNISCNLREKTKEWILCLHGLQSNKQLFDKIFTIPFFDKYSLLAIDFVGFGKSSKPMNFSYDIKEQAEICKKIIKQLKIEKMHIIGHSMGGMIGTILLKSLSNKIVSFVNMEGNLVFEDKGTSAKVSNYSFEEFKEKQYDILKSRIKKSNETSANYRSKWNKLIPDFVFYKASKSIVEWSKSRKLLDLFIKSKNKKLYIYGEKNSNKTTSSLHAIELEKISNAGHFMILDNPNECYDKIIKFLSN